MQANNLGSIEERRLDLEIKRLDLDAQNCAAQREADSVRLKQEQSSKLWTQISVMVPVVIIILSYWLNQISDNSKRQSEIHLEQVKEQKSFIRKQLSDLYYPLALHLQKDDAIWDLWNANQFSDKNKAIAVEIEKTILIPNHEEVINIIDKNFYLVKNDYESTDLSVLYEKFNHYQRHIAAYKALRATGDRRNPIDLGEEYAFPPEFSKVIAGRIKQLESQYQLTQ